MHFALYNTLLQFKTTPPPSKCNDPYHVPLQTGSGGGAGRVVHVHSTQARHFHPPPTCVHQNFIPRGVRFRTLLPRLGRDVMGEVMLIKFDEADTKLLKNVWKIGLGLHSVWNFLFWMLLDCGCSIVCFFMANHVTGPISMGPDQNYPLKFEYCDTVLLASHSGVHNRVQRH